MKQLFLIAGGSGEGDGDGVQVDPDEMVRQALEDKRGQDAGSQAAGNDPKDPPAPVKPAAEAKPDVAWFLAKRDVKKSCPALDDEDIAVLEAAAQGDPVKFVELAEKQQAKRETLIASRPKENEQEELRRKAAEEVLSGGGPGGSGVVKPKEPTPQEKIEKAVKEGDTRGIMRGIGDVINKGKDGKPLFDGVQIGPE